MSEENQTVEAGQETQAVETPSAPVVSDEQAKTTGTPEQSNPAAPPVEKTSEQVEKDRAFFQSELAKTKAELKGLSKEPVASPQAVVSPTQPAQQIPGLSNEELEQKMRDEPLVALQVLAEHSTNIIKQEFVGMRENIKAETRLSAESDSANRLVKEFCTKHDISPEVQVEATKKVAALGVQGSPAKMAELILEFAQMGKFQANGAVNSTQIAADVAETVKNQQLTMQPATGAPSSPTSISAQDGIANKFKLANKGGDMSRLLNE